MLGARRAALNVWQPGAAGHFFLRQHGLRLAGHFTRFSAPLPLQAPLRGFPAEFTIRTFAQVTELETLARAFEQCYAVCGDITASSRWPSYRNGCRRWTRREFCWCMMQASGWLACAGSRSMLNSAPSAAIKIGSIDAPGWVAEQRSAAHTTALLFLAADWLSGRGAKQAVLESWGDPPETLLLFQRAGFHLERQISEYGIELDGIH